MQTSFLKSIVCAGLFSAGLSGAALAMPIGDLSGVSSSAVTRVDYACGRGWHLNDWNECVRNRWHRPPPPPFWGDRGWGARYGAWGEGHGRWRHHHRPPPPDWGDDD